MNIEYFSKAEKFDLYTILGCEYKDSKESIKSKAKILLKQCHPDKTRTQGFQSEFFSLVNYSFKVLCNPLLRVIYDNEGHRGLKIFHNNYEEFEKVLAKYPSKALEDEHDENFIEAVEKILKKLRKIKFDLIKTNLHKYTNDKQKLKGFLDLSEYLNYKNEKSQKKSSPKGKSTEIKENKKSNSSNRERDNFLDVISKSNRKTNPPNYTESSYPINHLVYLNKIQISQGTLFKPQENVVVKINNIMKYDLNDKKLKSLPKLSAYMPINYLHYSIFTKTLFDATKSRFKSTLYFSELKQIPFIQKPFIRSYYDYKKKRISLSLGSKYKDEACKVKSSFIIPKKNFKFFFQTYLRDAYYSIIGFNLKNLKKLNLFYKGNITNDIEIFTKLKFCLRKSYEVFCSVVYSISDNFKLQVVNQISIVNKVNYQHQFYNIICIGFQFRMFTFRLPVIVSRVESSANFLDIIFWNLLVNGIVYSVHMLKKLIF